MANRLTYFRDHAQSWDADDHFNGLRVTWRTRLANRIELGWLYFITPIVCAFAGHKFVDDDPGDPEVGPQPQVCCTRCGKN
jgi:hypothetical protein